MARSLSRSVRKITIKRSIQGGIFLRFIDDGKFCAGEKILIFGRGIAAAGSFIQGFNIDPENVLGFVESKKSDDKFFTEIESMKKFNGKPIFSVNEIASLEFDRIFIANVYYNTLEETLAVGIPEEKIFIASHEILDEYVRKKTDSKIRLALPSVISPIFQSKPLAPTRIAEQDGNFIIIGGDNYIRTSTLMLLADEIRDRKIAGEIAELGVFRGDTSEQLNRWFPNRTLNLFDTFEGYVEEEVQSAVQQGLIDQVSAKSLNRFRTVISEKFVMSRMTYPEQVRIYKGLFPDTAPKEEKTFALVLIDVSFYIPTLAGLRYFYPRLAKNGYIMIQSYNVPEFSEGNHKAILELEAEFGNIAKIPIADRRGSLIITK